MMLPLKDEMLNTHSRSVGPSSTAWLYLTAEFLIGAILSGFLIILSIIKSFLPKPPRDLTDNVVLVAGASTSLGRSLADEFAKDGCFVICLDNDQRSLDQIVSQLGSHCPRVEEVRPRHRKADSPQPSARSVAYRCDFSDRKDIRRTAKKIKDEVGRIDVLVTCVGSPNQGIFDTASNTLMSHYWTLLAFLPLLTYGERAHVIGITPVTSSEDAYLGSRAAIASLMETMGQELSDRSGNLTFMAVSPIVEHNQVKEAELKTAREIVQAVKRDQSSLTVSWSSRVLYQISCRVYNAITAVTQWVYTQGCDYSF